METVKPNVKNVLKLSGMTKVELRQAIDNLTRMNANGQYSERIATYKSELATLEAKPCNVIVTNVVHSPAEQQAIMMFNTDKRFSYHN